MWYLIVYDLTKRKSYCLRISSNDTKEHHKIMREISAGLKYEDKYVIVISSSTIEIDQNSPHYFVYSTEEMLEKLKEG